MIKRKKKNRIAYSRHVCGFHLTPDSTISKYSTMSSMSILSPLSTPKQHLLHLISDQNRGLRTQSNPLKLSQIISTIEELSITNKDKVTTDQSLSATWRMLWTTEKEQLFIVKNAGFFGTEAGDVLQVIDVEKKMLNNVITFPPHGVFFVRSDMDVVSMQRVNFK